MSDDILFLYSLIAIPLVAVIIFVICLASYIRYKKNGILPDDAKSIKKLSDLQTVCIVTGIIAAVFVFTVLAGGILFMMFMMSM